MDTPDHTTVTIVGAGVAGLALGNFLLHSGIDCIIVERHSRAHIEGRARAGSLDGDGTRILRNWDLAEAMEGHTGHSSGSDGMPLLIDGQVHHWRLDGDTDGGVFCPQQVLVRNLIAVFLRDGGDLRFEAAGVAVDKVDEDAPVVRYRDADGAARQITCDFVAGCDGDRGVSRTSVPAGRLTRYSHEHGYAWLAVLADVPADPPAVMVVHSRGFAAQITRGADTSRFYLQCPLTDTIDQWPDERIWTELAARFGAPTVRGRISDKQVVPLRGVVYSPMSVGRLFLLGDAAHIVSPMSAKGMSLALHDAEVFARAVIGQVRDGRADLLDGYSETCLRHTWDAQTSAVWITDVMHNAGDSSFAGEFHKELARVELMRLLAAPESRRVFD